MLCFVRKFNASPTVSSMFDACSKESSEGAIYAQVNKPTKNTCSQQANESDDLQYADIAFNGTNNAG